MLSLLLTLAGLYLGSVVLMIAGLRKAPCGYQKDGRFYFGPEPAPGNSRDFVIGPVRSSQVIANSGTAATGGGGGAAVEVDVERMIGAG